ncbi:hypothetical protein GCM10008955_35480 [Deinococcus malanensis]|uniref:Uncharacterized protein n=1 Tax=Deinococcus malanensis TaxID=1706855 RepID=A0ABQ2F0Y8_9DEIO|nr:hypothetical protein [Deinococcus malanensis]GGK38540.1 hypothetical protein GCM10008955_35480 [Deinococcus malanensis]
MTDRILNIPVTPADLCRWRLLLAPERQPFFLTAGESQGLELPSQPRAGHSWTPEDRDTFTIWNVAGQADRVAWLTFGQWAQLPQAKRRALLGLQVRHGRGNVPLGQHYVSLVPGLTPGRFLWRAELLTPAVLDRLFLAGAAPCQRDLVPRGVWKRAASSLPRVEALAGTFAEDGQAGNCFGAVMGAAGIAEAEHAWMQRAPFEAFVRDHTSPGGGDDQPGTLLIWRSADGLSQHAAVTLGGGWAFHKPSQSWMTPRQVLPVRTIIRRHRTRGHRLSRFSLG